MISRIWCVDRDEQRWINVDGWTFVDGHRWIEGAKRTDNNRSWTKQGWMSNRTRMNIRWNDNKHQTERQRTSDRMATDVGWNGDEHWTKWGWTSNGTRMDIRWNKDECQTERRQTSNGKTEWNELWLWWTMPEAVLQNNLHLPALQWLCVENFFFNLFFYFVFLKKIVLFFFF